MIDLPQSQLGVLQVLRLLRDPYAVLHWLQLLFPLLEVFRSIGTHGQTDGLRRLREVNLSIYVGFSFI